MMGENFRDVLGPSLQLRTEHFKAVVTLAILERRSNLLVRRPSSVAI